MTSRLRGFIVPFMPEPSTTQRFADLLLGQPVIDWAAKLRSDGWSWGRISNELYALHNLHITAETLRTWCLTAETTS